jgi:hypothetical protein
MSNDRGEFTKPDEGTEEENVTDCNHIALGGSSPYLQRKKEQIET